MLTSQSTDKSTLMVVPSKKSSQLDIIDTKSQTCIGYLSPDLPKSPGMVMVLRPTDSDSEVIAGYEDGSVALWDIRKFKMVDRLSCYSESVMCLDYCGSLSKGLCGSVNNTLFSWKLSQDRKFVMDNSLHTNNV